MTVVHCLETGHGQSTDLRLYDIRLKYIHITLTYNKPCLTALATKHLDTSIISRFKTFIIPVTNDT